MPPISAVIAVVRAWRLWPVLADYAARLWRWLMADLWRLAALLALAWGAVQSGKADDWQQRATTAEANLTNTLSASKQAAAKAEAARLATEAASAAHARITDHAEPLAIADHRAAADRYAAAHRLRAAPDCSVPSGTAEAGQDRAAQDRDGPGPDAVVIPLATYNQLRDNTLRLERVRIWGEGEIEEGRAVKVGD